MISNKTMGILLWDNRKKESKPKGEKKKPLKQVAIIEASHILHRNNT